MCHFISVLLYADGPLALIVNCSVVLYCFDGTVLGMTSKMTIQALPGYLVGPSVDCFVCLI